MLLLDEDIWTFIFIILAQESSLALACVLKFYRDIGNELRDLRHVGVVAKKYTKFWVLDGIINNQKQIVGSVALATPDGEVYDQKTTVALKRLSVTPNLRRMKIGSKMLEHAIHQATKLGFQRMVLYCGDRQQPALKLYKKYGFEITKIIDRTILSVLPDVPILCMEKQLR
ncbi:N-acetyltransferase family 8 member 3-like [Styela clava]